MRAFKKKPLGRINLFEWMDRDDIPSRFRKDFQEALSFYYRVYYPKVVERFAHRVADLLKKSELTSVVELAAGAGETGWLLKKSLSSLGVAVDMVLTDYYPNPELFDDLRRRQRVVGLRYHSEPVDARDVPPSLKGVRVICTAFHHFEPTDAGQILSSAVRDKTPIVILETTRRHIVNFIGSIVGVISLFWMAPFIRPFRFGRLFWVYVVPLLPLVMFWDGFASCLRTYSPKEFMKLTEPFPNYQWQVETWFDTRILQLITIYFGQPKPVQ